MHSAEHSPNVGPVSGATSGTSPPVSSTSPPSGEPVSTTSSPASGAVVSSTTSGAGATISEHRTRPGTVSLASHAAQLLASQSSHVSVGTYRQTSAPSAPH